MLKNKSLILILSLILLFVFPLSIIAISEKQAPELQKAVREGELEALENRLPDEPLIAKNEVGKIGKYGGTWNRFTNWEEFGHFRMSLYGHSWVRFVDDGTNIAPNLAVDWEKNDDATEWTFYFREGIKWSDGEEFTVDDILFWWEDMVLDDDFVEVVPDEFKAGGETAKLSKIDDYTLKVEYAAPAPILPQRLAMWPNRGLGPRMITPAHYMKQFHPVYSDEYENYEELEERLDWWYYPEAPTLTAWKPAEYKAGDHLYWERNPYYWAVDSKGNQLPYIDKVEDEFVSDKEVFKLKVIDGESDMQIRPPLLNTEDISILKEKEEENNFRTLMWESGSGSGPVFIPNRNHLDEEKRQLYQTPEFMRAISHAINRARINKMVFYNTGNPTTGTISPKTPEYQTETGKDLYQQWKNLAVEYDPEKAEAMLDEVGVVDQNDDGWREMPNGDDLTLRIDTDAEASDEYMQTNELVKEDWEEIGVKTIINTVDSSELTTIVHNTEFDIRNSWEIGGGMPVAGPHWMVPVNQDRWAPLYGNWYRIQGTSQEGVDANKPPRERSPRWKKPPEGGVVDKLQSTYDKAKVASTEEDRNKYVYKLHEITIENGPFVIGTIEDYLRIGIVSKK